MKRAIPPLVLVLGLLSATPPGAFALPLIAVEYEQPAGIAGSEVSRMVTISPGDEYSQAEVDRNRRLLEATGLFRTVDVESVKEEKGYRVVFRTDPYEIVRKVSLKGNFLMLKKNLVRIVRLEEGDPFREEAAAADVAGLLRIYEAEGYHGTEVKTEVKRGRKGVKVTYRITEGKPMVIRSCEFQGNDSIPVSELSSLLRLTLYTFFRQENLVKTIDEIEEFYRERGYLDVMVDSGFERDVGMVIPTFTLVNPVKGLATLLPGQYLVVDITLTVREGRKYEVDFEGNESYTEADLRERLTFTETGFFDEHEVEISRRGILEFYRERGFYRAEVDKDFDRGAARVVFTVKEGDRYPLGRILFRGVESLGEDLLRSRMKLWDTGLFDRRYLREDYLEEDYRRLRDHYRYEGYLEVEVKQPVVVLDATPEGADVYFAVREGTRSLVGEITFEGVTAVDEESLREVVKSEEEVPFRPDWVTEDKERILRLVNGKGYPQCRVHEKVFFSPERGTVDIHFIVEEGPLRRLGTIEVVGNRKTKDRVLLREIPLAPGSPFSFAALSEGKRTLYGLGYFKEVRMVSPVQVEGLETRDVVIEVRERPTGLFRFGGGFNSEERFQGFVELGEQNLFGTGRGLSARAQASTIKRRYDLFYREPWPLGYRINSEADLFEEFKEEKGYDIVRRGVNVGVKKKLGLHFTINPRYRFELVEYQNVELVFLPEGEEVPEDFDITTAIENLGEEEPLDPINISSAIVFLGFDLRDNPVDPRRGSYHLAGVEVATPLLGGDTTFNKYTFEASWFLPMTARSEMALGFRGGFAQTFTGFESLPLSERFFLGGPRGVRGYPEDEVGPKDAAGNPLGGDAYALGIAEYRFPLGKKRWRGVVFFDIGNVWTSLEAIEPTEAKIGVGVGLRYHTPVGPLRLDYGFKVRPEEGESPGRLYFSIGYPI